MRQPQSWTNFWMIYFNDKLLEVSVRLQGFRLITHWINPATQIQWTIATKDMFFPPPVGGTPWSFRKWPTFGSSGTLVASPHSHLGYHRPPDPMVYDTGCSACKCSHQMAIFDFASWVITPFLVPCRAFSSGESRFKAPGQPGHSSAGWGWWWNKVEHGETNQAPNFVFSLSLGRLGISFITPKDGMLSQSLSLRPLKADH